MLRVSHYIDTLLHPGTASHPPARKPTGPVVIWNLIRRCNLTCKHCYASAADTDFAGELSTEEVFAVLDDLRAFGVPALILSGGEPLMRPDIYIIAKQAKKLGLFVGLSSNGTLIDETRIADIAAVGFDYVGISLDGLKDNHDHFRRRDGAFDDALRGIRQCRDAGLKVGLRFTLTRDNAVDWPALLDLSRDEGIDKIYLSHLNYAGRGNHNRIDDPRHVLARWAVEEMFTRCLKDARLGNRRDYVSGNNDADGAYLYLWACKYFPDQAEALYRRLLDWGGNASGVNVANIDNLGNVHPDTMWWNHTLGNVRQRPFSAIWPDTSDPLMAGLKCYPRPVGGRCATCSFLSICNGNTRTRAFQLTGDPWSEDPGCYLTDEEIGVTASAPRVEVSAFGDGPRHRRLNG